MMSRAKTEKSFDSLAYKRRVQSEVYEDVKEMSFEEERAYFQQRAERGPLGQWWKRIQAARREPTDR